MSALLQVLLRRARAIAVLAVALCAVSTPAAAVTAPTPVHNYRGAVPVLCYHGIHENSRAASDPYSIPQAEFERHMAMLAGDGFHPISIEQYARFAAGDVSGLPDRPILITFDDGRLDSFEGADPVLARYGMRATMFVIAANATSLKPGYLGWAKLRAMAGSGRWDVQEHANAGHVLIPTGPGNRTGPFYANLLYRNGVREKFTAFKRRVTSDILAGRRLMSATIPGFRPLAFAVPYSNYGQQQTNYAPIAAWEIGWLQRTFAVVFVQDRRVYNLPGTAVGQRYGVRASTTAATLRRWLTQMLPPGAWTLDSKRLVRPKRPKLRRMRIGRRSVVIVLRRRGLTRLTATRHRAGRHRNVRVPVRGARVRDRRLRPGTVYVYRVVAVSRAGKHSRPLKLRLRTRR